MPDLTELAARCEAADASEQRELLELAYRTLFPEPSKGSRSWRNPEWQDWADRFNRFWAMLKAEAYESAALMLVPEGWGWNVLWPNIKARESGLLRADAPCHGEVQFGAGQRFIVAAATPALALTAASLRAIASKENDNG